MIGILIAIVWFHVTEVWRQGARRIEGQVPPMLCSASSVLGPPYSAKVVVAGLGSLFPHRSVHRQKMAVCPGSSSFIREEALSHKQLHHTFRLSSQDKVKCPPYLMGVGVGRGREYQDTRISLHKL